MEKPESKSLFVRIPLENIKLEDPYEQYKFDQMKSINQDNLIKYVESILKDMIVRKEKGREGG